MVMEAPPSPQSVGREFVRQYYTLLNQAPIHLHRFYNNQSSFVHGGLDPPNRETSPMIGQKQIHQKIQQLNFRDCHAKITQVDAQATLGNGVVVQVTGELSNAGEPMRRFTQTFVLAAQSPKKYYVHNDIFRYQDVIVSDDECENECRSEPEEDLVQEHQVIEEMPQLTQQPIPYYNPNQPLPTAMSHHHGQVATTVPHVLPPQPIATVNGNVHADDINSLSAGPIVPSQGQTLGSSISNLQTGVSSPPSNVIDEIQVQEELPIVDDALEQNFVNNQDPVINQDLNQETTLATEPKTYATLLKSGGGSTAYNPTMTPMSFNNTKSVSPPLNQPRYENRDAPLANQQSGNQNSGPLGQRPGGNRGPRNSQPRQRQDSRNGPNPKNNFIEETGTYDDKRKAPTHGNGALGDSHQLFMGNLPHAATEDELREIFSAYGTIVDLRIHSKPGKMVLGVRYPPNYGFLTYDNQSAVQKVLAARPIYYPTASEEGAVILNIEEKKTKDRLSYGGSRSGADNGGGIRNRDNGNRRPGPPRGGGAGGGGGGGGNNGSGGGLVGGGGTGGNRPNFNKIPSNRPSNSSNTYNNRR